mgnify:CR=1 FL=1
MHTLRKARKNKKNIKRINKRNKRKSVRKYSIWWINRRIR